MSTNIKRILQFLVFIGLGVGIMYLVFRSQNTAFQEQCRLDGVAPADCRLVDKLWADFTSVSPFWMMLVMLAFTVSNLFRALRWQMLTAPMGHHISLANSFLPILLGYFANLGFPRLGEIMRAGALSRYENIPFEKVIGTLVIDRFMDFLCLLLVLALAFLFEADTLWAFMQQQQGARPDSGGPLSSPWVQALLVLMVVGGVLSWVFRARLLATPLFQKIAGMVEGFWVGLRSVFTMSSPGLFIAYSLGIWLMFYLQAYFNLRAFGPTAHLGLQAALMVFVFGTMGFLIPSPGGMGTYHALCIAGLSLYGIKGNDAFSYANISFFAVQIFYNLVGGMLALLLLPWINRKPRAGVSTS
ncbi:MAG: lysylphosphatidylglycerol synthase transmembrane domain-containing protein [Saprospiraceae bacterium]